MRKALLHTILTLLLFSFTSVHSQIVISEIMMNAGDPLTPKSNGQWFELYNNSDTAIDLRGWTIEGTFSHKIYDPESNPREEPFYIQPGEFFVFVTSTDTSKNGGLIADYENPFDLMNGNLKIFEPGNLVPVDEIIDFHMWFYDFVEGVTPPYAASIVLTDLSADNNLWKNWTTSTIREGRYNQEGEDLGSPGTLGSSAFLQMPKIEWDSIYGGDGQETIHTMLVTKDGGCIMGGMTESGISGEKTEASKGEGDYWLVKTDKNGTIEWDKTIGGDDYDELKAIVQTRDGGYILGGESKSGISGDKTEAKKSEREDFWLVQLDNEGKKIWDKTIGGDDIDFFKSIENTSDGGFILGGHSFSNISGEKTENCKGVGDYWIVKLDSDLNIEWDKTLGGDENDVLTSVLQTSDGGYIAGGDTYSGISGDKTAPTKGYTDFWIVKLNANGTKAWDKTYGGDWNEKMESILETKDGGYILGGWVTDNNWYQSSILVIKTDKNGNVEWEKEYSTKELNSLSSIEETDDGGYIIGGEKGSAYGVFSYLWIIKTDEFGNLIWEKTISRASNEHLASIQITEDGGYLIGAETPIRVSDNEEDDYYDFWLVKLSSDPTTIPTNPNVSANLLQTKNFHLNIYPNPAQNEFKVQSSEFYVEEAEVEIYDFNGRKLIEKQIPTGTINEEIDVRHLKNGVYFFKLSTKKESVTKKLIIQK